jgi:hypothetical protein
MTLDCAAEESTTGITGNTKKIITRHCPLRFAVVFSIEVFLSRNQHSSTFVFITPF